MGKDQRINQHRWYYSECLLQPSKNRRQMKPPLCSCWKPHNHRLKRGATFTNKEDLLAYGLRQPQLKWLRDEFKILRGVTKTNSKIRALDFWRTDLDLFRDMLGKIPLGGALKGKGAQESWLIKDSLLEHGDGLLPCVESWASMAGSHGG